MIFDLYDNIKIIYYRKYNKKSYESICKDIKEIFDPENAVEVMF